MKLVFYKSAKTKEFLLATNDKRNLIDKDFNQITMLSTVAHCHSFH